MLLDIDSSFAGITERLTIFKKLLDGSYWSKCINCKSNILIENTSTKFILRLRHYPHRARLSGELCIECYSFVYHAIPQAFEDHSEKLKKKYKDMKKNYYSLKEKHATEADLIEGVFEVGEKVKKELEK